MPKPPAPLQQGDLDGLCGAYAIVNAVTHLLHDRGFTRPEANRLFRSLCRTLHRRQKMPQAVWRGTYIEDIDAMLRTVQRHVRESFGLRLRIARPFAGVAVRRKDKFFKVLSGSFEATEGRKVAIIGLDKPGFHWTIAADVNHRCFRLYDSGRSKQLRYGDCTLGKTVHGRQVILPAETRILALDQRPILRVAATQARKPAMRHFLRDAA
jgi:hypothetical protein